MSEPKYNLKNIYAKTHTYDELYKGMTMGKHIYATSRLTKLIWIPEAWASL